MNKRKILITGGTGYIGSHTVCRMLENGDEVVSADNLSNSYEDVNERIEKITGKRPVFVNTELCDPCAVKSLFSAHPDISGIIHFAAFKSVGESVLEPLKYYRNNLNALVNVLQEAVSHNVRSFVFSSSCTVYGQPSSLPVSELSPVQQAWSPYGNTKKICEEILRDFCSVNHNFHVVSLRYFNPIGAHPSGLIGELPVGIPNNLLPFLTQTAIGIQQQLQIFGGDYQTPDGTAIRDYIHVEDLAEAHINALDYSENTKKKSCFEVFNLGTGRGYSVLEIVNTFQKVNGVKIPYRITERRLGDVEQIWADPSKASKVLGWKAKRSLEDMLRDAWKWEQFYRRSNDFNK